MSRYRGMIWTLCLSGLLFAPRFSDCLEARPDVEAPVSLELKTVYEAGNVSLLTTDITRLVWFVRRVGEHTGADRHQGEMMIPLPTPEPTTLFLLATGLVSVIGYGWRRNRFS